MGNGKVEDLEVSKRVGDTGLASRRTVSSDCERERERESVSLHADDGGRRRPRALRSRPEKPSRLRTLTQSAPPALGRLDADKQGSSPCLPHSYFRGHLFLWRACGDLPRARARVTVSSSPRPKSCSQKSGAGRPEWGTDHNRYLVVQGVFLLAG
ncbi:uncharacterized protein B0I36DRAFT_321886 [Microdochium trichocladiopsis]|uniref:Uncharacterized protein n=1 Tax=Microdochium trichocladiopsis TaxID=1682393 RepID=A0A9P9BVU7_9PEZI|nr:uncharacterized protein B0I36DRAFT_321886 [Microdochium trichocladiopsis]KAH7033687.1 hypothetical protein B0I36DRAFT_321886 [Microdochium trichocladiopsis]